VTVLEESNKTWKSQILDKKESKRNKEGKTYAKFYRSISLFGITGHIVTLYLPIGDF
jgi:hypothetical protein